MPSSPMAAGDYRHLSPPSYFNTESYAYIDENDFQLVSASPLSTFLDRRGPGFIRQRAPVHPAGGAATRRCGPH